MESSNIAIVAFDIETRGKSMIRNGILSVGVVVGLLDETIILTRQWNVDKINEEQEFEERCMEEFWNKQPKELLVSLQNNTVPADQFAKEFRSLLDQLEEAYEIYLLSDNPTFDAGYINYYLDLYGYDSMQFKRNGKSYRLVHDSDSYACGAAHAPISYNWPSDKEIQKLIGFTSELPTLNPHNPVDDATKIFLQFVHLVKTCVPNERYFYQKLEEDN